MPTSRPLDPPLMSGRVKSDRGSSTFSLEQDESIRPRGARAGSTRPSAIGDDFMVLVYNGHADGNTSDEA
ncbi:hypothetical protein ECG_00675 [Echinococcus granulosus]|uniref:Uncharacterized protein n=1 Tax=Echinococcus granulosus TaxID=6210 RepID=A0A068WDF9_ECHGR|nr:hypothetical protein ECG_00675 [Echinococcus granulosus]CDS16467.1 hypothetical protein EgrG_002019700 [Echinococcus granulosus]